MQPSIENIALKRKCRAVSTFLKKTYELLNESENNVCVVWAPNGIGFIVTNQDLFSKTVLPKYFKHSNYSSFVRQLNMYNFHKIRQANSESYFHHQCFDRHNKDLMAEIKRKPQKKKRKNDESQDENQQNDSIQLHHKSMKKSCQNEKTSLKVPSQQQVSIKLILSSSQHQKQQTSTIRHILPTNSSENIQYKKYPLKQSQLQIKQEFSSEQKNLFRLGQDDRISINEEIMDRMDRIPRFNIKEFICPSTNNLFPFFDHQHNSNFAFFY